MLTGQSVTGVYTEESELWWRCWSVVSRTASSWRRHVIEGTRWERLVHYTRRYRCQQTHTVRCRRKTLH